MVREKYPEKVPFRLTRMLIQAMEVSGIEGTFRITCENSMRVLRDNKESIMAVLEAFVHDPLINWRLINTGKHLMTYRVRSITDNAIQVDAQVAQQVLMIGAQGVLAWMRSTHWMVSALYRISWLDRTKAFYRRSERGSQSTSTASCRSSAAEAYG
jgi:hypothetical protein